MDIHAPLCFEQGEFGQQAIQIHPDYFYCQLLVR
jgi:hypothetical protein